MVLRRIADWFTAETQAQTLDFERRSAIGGGRVIPWQADRPQWPDRTVDTFDQGAYRRVGLIWRCVQELSGAAGSAPLRVFQERDGEPVADPDHPLRQLLQRPNGGMGEARFLSFVAMNMAVTGFVVIEKERDRLGNVIGLWPLRSDWLRAIPRQQAAPDWEYRVPGYQDPFRLFAEDVIAIPYADTPDQSPIGIGPLEVLLREIGIANTMRDFVKVFFDRGAMPLYVMVPSDDPRHQKQWEDQKVKDAFMDAFRQRYGGLPNAVEPMPLVGIKDIKPLGFDFNQLAYPELTKMTEATICTTFGVPAILVGAQVGLDRSTFSNTAEARRAFFEDTMTYLWSRLDDAFTRDLLPEFEVDPTYNIEFDTTDIPALQDDENDRVTRAVSMFSSGMASRHAGQRHAGIKPHGPDEFLVPFNMVATPNANGQRGATIELVPNGYRELPGPRIVTRDGRKYLNERVLSPEERAAQDQVAATHRSMILQLAGRAEPVVRGYLVGQRDRVVQAVTGERSLFVSHSANGHNAPVYGLDAEHAFGTRAVEDIDWSEESRLLQQALDAWLSTVGEESFGLAATEIGLDDSMWHVSNAYLRELQDVLGQRIVGITDTTRADVERIVRDALLEGSSIPDLTEKLTGLYEETFASRSATIARTESMHAFNTASTMAYQASGQVSEALLHDNSQHVEHYGASDGLSCAERNNLIVPLTNVSRHVAAEHPNGTLAVSPVVRPLEGE